MAEKLIPGRRSVLAGAGAVLGSLAGASALAACSSGGSKAQTDATTGTPAPSTSSDAATGTTSGTTTGTTVATLSDIAVGQAVSAELAGKPVLVARPTATTAACFSAICPHQGCTVAPDETILRCPCHHSEFDMRTGAVLQGPANRALTTIEVTVSDGRVVAT